MESKVNKLIGIENVTSYTRDEVVPMYANLIMSSPPDDLVLKVNQAILSKWSNSGLNYIKTKAWKIVETIHGKVK